MKQKYSNIILSIFNIIMIVLFGLMLVMQANIKIPMSLFAIKEPFEQLMWGYEIGVIVILIANIISIIQNKTNKKIMLWYMIPTIFYISGVVSLSMGLFEIDFLSYVDSVLYRWVILPAIIFMILLIKELRKEKRKKVLILYILGIVMSIVIYFIEYRETIWLVISSIIIIIYSRKIDEENKSQKIISSIYLGVITLLSIYIIMHHAMIIGTLHDINKKSFEYMEQIETGLINEKIKPSDTLIKVVNNNKWGYINQRGEEIISCEYDCISDSESWYASGDRAKSRFVVAKKDDMYYVISKNGKILTSHQEIPTPYWNDNALEFDEDISDEERTQDIIDIATATIKSLLQTEFEDRERPLDNNLIPEEREFNEDYNYVYKYKLTNGYKLEVEETDYKETYKIRIKKNNAIIREMEYVNIIFVDDYDFPEGTIKTYTNGDIPIYNLDKELLEENMQLNGYISMQYMNFFRAEGNRQILDIIHRKIILRDYEQLPNITEYIINNETNEIVVKAKEIYATEYGYIIKKDNNKFVYLDINLNEVTQEFDFISPDYIKDGLLICVNKQNEEYILCDLKGNRITNKKYSFIGKDYSDYENASKEYLLDEVYEEIYNTY